MAASTCISRPRRPWRPRSRSRCWRKPPPNGTRSAARPDREAALRRIVSDYLDPARVASAHGCPLTTLGPDVARRTTSREAIGDALRGMLDALARVLPGRKRQTGAGITVHDGRRGRAVAPGRRPGPGAKRSSRPQPTASCRPKATPIVGKCCRSSRPVDWRAGPRIPNPWVWQTPGHPKSLGIPNPWAHQIPGHKQPEPTPCARR